MRVNDFILWMISIKISNDSSVPPRLPGLNRGHPVNSSPQCLDFIVICSLLLSMDHKVKLNFCTVQFSVIIHHHGFCSATVHDCKQIQNPYWLCFNHESSPHPFKTCPKYHCYTQMPLDAASGRHNIQSKAHKSPAS